jgi:opacity protein-like surface antigen
MKRTLLVFGAILLFGLAGFAQTADYPKFELSGTASALMFDIDKLGNETMWGYGIGANYNVNKYFGIGGEWNANHGESTFTPTDTEIAPFKLDLRVQTIMFGPQVSYRAKIFTVFGRFLVGAGTLKADDDIGYFNYSSVTKWQVAYAIGGGLDINLGKNFAIRPIQLDYVFIDSDLPQALGSSQAPGAFNNVRYNFGAVFKF